MIAGAIEVYKTLGLPPVQSRKHKAATLLAFAAAGYIRLTRFQINECHLELTVDWKRERAIEQRRAREFADAMQGAVIQ